MDRPIIYTIGDSHGWHGWLNIPNVSTNHVGGPMTMHSFNQTINTPNHPYLKIIPLDGILCFCFGEIDCRCHVHRFQPWKDTIDKLVEGYAKAIKNSVADRDPKTIWVYFVPPPVHGVKTRDGFPFSGTIEERISYVKYMNEKLKELPYTFVDLYDKYSNEDGSMIIEDSDYYVHIKNIKPLIEWIDNECLRTFTE